MTMDLHSWIPGVAQNIVSAILIALAVVAFQRYKGGRASAERKSFSKRATLVLLLGPGAQQSTRLLAFTAGELAKLIGFSGIAIAGFILSLINSTTRYSLSVVIFVLIWEVVAIVGLLKAISAYLNLRLLYHTYYETEHLTEEQQSKLDAEVEARFGK